LRAWERARADLLLAHGRLERGHRQRRPRRQRVLELQVLAHLLIRRVHSDLLCPDINDEPGLEQLGNGA
jgi:hypothetical protein